LPHPGQPNERFGMFAGDIRVVLGFLKTERETDAVVVVYVG
jgi:hypothetical protein